MRTLLLTVVAVVLGSTLIACGDDDAAVDSGTADTGTGSEDSGTTDAGSDDARAADAGDPCVDAETLPETINADTTVGPGCVRIDRTSVTDDATLTIAAGTKVLMAAGGFLSISPYGDGSALVSIGTPAAPIVFTSEAASPLPGDWQCVRITGASSNSEIRNTTFEYGGDPCDVTGNAFEGMLMINASARAVSGNTFRHSRTHGVLIQPQGGVRQFQDNSFADNMTASIEIAAGQLLVLGTGNSFADADDRIDIDNTFALATEGTWLGQPVPFRSIGNLAIRDHAVTMGAGLTLQMNGGSIDVFTGGLNIEGTEEAPVTITSSASAPIKGDWGCIVFSSIPAAPRFDHAIIEYGGNGSGCSGAMYRTAVAATTESPIITNSTFRHIAGSAIRSISCDMTAAWCMNTFETVDVGPLECGFGEVPTACL